ncbi:MAG: dihydrolipoyl dehydrogenase [Acidimicrobiia bacterium]
MVRPDMSMASDRIECDIAIVGGGPGGYAAALHASRLGLGVVVVEKEKVGGTCLHRGCVPAKHFLETAAVLRTVKKAQSFGIEFVAPSAPTGSEVGQPRLGGSQVPTVNWSAVVARKSSLVERLWRGLSNLLESAGVVIVEGEGVLDDSGSVVAHARDGSVRIVTARKGVILASGSTPRQLDALQPDGDLVVTSDEVFDIKRLPESVLVVGAGSVGVEVSTYLAEFGSNVTLVEALPNVLQGADEEVSSALERALAALGVEVICNARVLGLEKIPDRIRESGFGVCHVRRSGGEELNIKANLIVVAVGRAPSATRLGLEKVGVAQEPSGHVAVDPKTLQTSVRGIYAVGDLISTPALAHVAFAEGGVAVRAIVGEDPRPIDYRKVPWCVYTHPEVAFCGMTEAAAKTAYGEDSVRVSKVNFAGNARAAILGERRGMLKLVALADGPVVGVHIIGPWASELLSPGYLSTNWEAFPEEVAAYIQPHPTLSEILGEAAMALVGRPLHG